MSFMTDRPSATHARPPGRWRRLVAVVALTAAGCLGAVAVPSGVATAAPTVLEAESATLAGGAVLASDHTGFTGSGFVGGYVDGNRGSARTTFAVPVTTAGPTTCNCVTRPTMAAPGSSCVSGPPARHHRA